MDDFGEVLLLMEKIDPKYREYAAIKKEINEALDDSFSLDKLNYYFENEYFDDAYYYCEEHLGDSIGEGSSRAVFQIDDGRCLKIALNKKGIQQNKVESETNKDNYLLFPLIFGKSDNNYWVLTEYVLPAQESDFPRCVGLDFDDFYNFILDLEDQKYERYKIQYVVDNIREDKSGTLKSLYDYVVKNHIPCGDMLRICNWGMTVRNGKETLVLLDSGWNKETMKMYGGYVSPTKSKYSDKVSRPD